jgi:hypothetical protein
MFRVMGCMCAAFTLLIATGASSGPEERGVPVSLQGTWVLESIYKTHNIQGINTRQQNALLQSRIMYSQDTVSSCGQSVPVGGSLVQEISKKMFFEKTYVSLEELSVRNTSVTEVVLNGDNAGNCDGMYTVPGQDVYPLGNDYLIVNFGGVFYRAKRAK